MQEDDAGDGGLQKPEVAAGEKEDSEGGFDCTVKGCISSVHILRLGGEGKKTDLFRVMISSSPRDLPR